jgi:hypothetical protein
MKVEFERRALQGAIILGCLVPLLAGGAGMLLGHGMLRGISAATPDLDSHFRYLSGLLFGLGIGFLSCLPRIEARGDRMRLLGLLAFIGGLARAFSLGEDGPPSFGHQFALVMELAVVPALVIWQWRFAGRWRRARGQAG